MQVSLRHAFWTGRKRDWLCSIFLAADTSWHLFPPNHSDLSPSGNTHTCTPTHKQRYIKQPHAHTDSCTHANSHSCVFWGKKHVRARFSFSFFFSETFAHLAVNEELSAWQLYGSRRYMYTEALYWENWLKKSISKNKNRRWFAHLLRSNFGKASHLIAKIIYINCDTRLGHISWIFSQFFFCFLKSK